MYKTAKKKKIKKKHSYFNKKNKINNKNCKCNAGNSGNVYLLLFTVNYTTVKLQVIFNTVFH